jgi:hypothetical protein
MHGVETGVGEAVGTHQRPHRADETAPHSQIKRRYNIGAANFNAVCHLKEKGNLESVTRLRTFRAQKIKNCTQVGFHFHCSLFGVSGHARGNRQARRRFISRQDISTSFILSPEILTKTAFLRDWMGAERSRYFLDQDIIGFFPGSSGEPGSRGGSSIGGLLPGSSSGGGGASTPGIGGMSGASGGGIIGSGGRGKSGCPGCNWWFPDLIKSSKACAAYATEPGYLMTEQLVPQILEDFLPAKSQ